MELRGATLVHVPAALNRASVSAMRDAIAGASADSGSRAIVLRGSNPRTFCSGVDFVALAAGEDPAEAVEAFAACLQSIRRCSKPVICLVEGNADGGGVGIAAAADLVIATSDASFALPELLFGLTPAVVLPFLAERVSLQKLRWLALSSDRVGAFAAVELGLVDRVEPADRCVPAIESCLKRLTRVSPDAAAAWKRSTLTPPAIGSSDAIETTVRRLRSTETIERFRRFVEDGEPPWAAERS
jgi:enoyl-CoA hydratase/carnithine racemase